MFRVMERVALGMLMVCLMLLFFTIIGTAVFLAWAVLSGGVA